MKWSLTVVSTLLLSVRFGLLVLYSPVNHWLMYLLNSVSTLIKSDLTSSAIEVLQSIISGNKILEKCLVISCLIELMFFGCSLNFFFMSPLVLFSVLNSTLKPILFASYFSQVLFVSKLSFRCQRIIFHHFKIRF